MPTSLLDELLRKAGKALKEEEKVIAEGEVLIAPEDEKEFVEIDDEDLDELAESQEDEDGGAETLLILGNVLSIVATRKYPYAGYFKDLEEDADEVIELWGGEQPVDRFSRQDGKKYEEEEE